MKSSKGKAPANGTSRPKKVPQTPGNRVKPKDPVEVYCRLQPLKEDEFEACAEAISDSVLQITPPECSLAYKSGHRNGSQHTFKRVFDGNTGQKEIFDRIGFPLVEDLLQGKNGLLFAYGITNSGKTYTMTGEPDQAGILPRSLDIIFNSIEDVQAPKHVFRPDGTNGFDVFTEAEARVEQQHNMPKKVSARVRSEQPEYGDLLRIPEPRKVKHALDEDNSYTVFISYIEIYNNYVYDLLEEVPLDPIKPKPPPSHLLREDYAHRMYASGATEVEVRSTEEAFEILYSGQKRRRVAQTTLNHESSRSHSVFTIKLVQAPLDASGEEVVQDKSKVVASQLSLVDLAGSERASRTNSGGDRLREASIINAALMVLRTCMETLRDNQLNGAKKIVPYRDSKLTHLFKNYFDGEGKVTMIVCVSPRAGDYDETIHVMRFAEVTQEVVVDRPQTVRFDIGLAPGRRRANMLYKAALREAVAVVTEEGAEAPTTFNPNAPHPYALALGVLSVQKYISEECSSCSLSEFKAFLENRERIRAQLIDDLRKKLSAFRLQLLAQEQELGELREEVRQLRGQKSGKDKALKDIQKLKTLIASQDEQNAQLQAELEKTKSVQSHQVSRLQEQLSQVTQQKQILARTTEMYEVDKRELEEELDIEREQIAKQHQEKSKLRKTMQGFVSQEKQKFERLASQMKAKERDLAVKSEKLRQVTELIRNSPCTTRTPLRESTQGNTAAPVETPKVGKTHIPVRPKGRKRSLSENWLEHKPHTTVDNVGLLQPQMKKKKTLAAPKAKHFKSKQVDKYCLQHQEEDSEGDVKTELYKGQIIHTRGGGTSVQFTDVEVLQHTNPHSPVGKPRRSARLTHRLQGDGSDLSSSESSMEYDGEEEVEEHTDVETRWQYRVAPVLNQPLPTPGSSSKMGRFQPSSFDREQS